MLDVFSSLICVNPSVYQVQHQNKQYIKINFIFKFLFPANLCLYISIILWGIDDPVSLSWDCMFDKTLSMSFRDLTDRPLRRQARPILLFWIDKMRWRGSLKEWINADYQALKYCIARCWTFRIWMKGDLTCRLDYGTCGGGRVLLKYKAIWVSGMAAHQ